MLHKKRSHTTLDNILIIHGVHKVFERLENVMEKSILYHSAVSIQIIIKVC